MGAETSGSCFSPDLSTKPAAPVPGPFQHCGEDDQDEDGHYEDVHDEDDHDEDDHDAHGEDDLDDHAPVHRTIAVTLINRDSF